MFLPDTCDYCRLECKQSLDGRHTLRRRQGQSYMECSNGGYGSCGLVVPIRSIVEAAHNDDIQAIGRQRRIEHLKHG